MVSWIGDKDHNGCPLCGDTEDWEINLEIEAVIADDDEAEKDRLKQKNLKVPVKS